MDQSPRVPPEALDAATRAMGTALFEALRLSAEAHTAAARLYAEQLRVLLRASDQNQELTVAIADAAKAAVAAARSMSALHGIVVGALSTRTPPPTSTT